ncbi:acyclic terpene utilization AtuA family protein [Rhodococcus koreensis]
MSAMIRIANCSGFYGDRLSAAREMVEDGPIDVLTGDWLAELTMGVLAKQRSRDPQAGYARTFERQMVDVLGTCLDRGIKVVSNAGGLNPDALAECVREVARATGREVRVAVVNGDDCTDRVRTDIESGLEVTNAATGEAWHDRPGDLVVANAYLGCWGIVDALQAGADVVVTGRVTDAAIVLAPAAWRFGWAPDDLDKLAGAVVAGHVIECGAQASGGNFSFFDEFDGDQPYGLPIAEIDENGSAVITKHSGTGGKVTCETVLSQLLYEVDGPRYLTPDVVVRLDTLRLDPDGPDRVRISGTRGEAPPTTVKVGCIRTGGFRATMTLGLVGPKIRHKVERVEQLLWPSIVGGREAFDGVRVDLLNNSVENPESRNTATSLLVISVASRDRALVRRFVAAVVELGLSSYPGCFALNPPPAPTEFMEFWPVLMPASSFHQVVRVDGRPVATVPLPAPTATTRVEEAPSPRILPDVDATVFGPLAPVIGTRSGDKGGNATLGAWARRNEDREWLDSWWSEENLRATLPELAALRLTLWRLPNVGAVGATIHDYLGRGAAACLDVDAQAKGLGEYLRSRWAAVPAEC